MKERLAEGLGMFLPVQANLPGPSHRIPMSQNPFLVKSHQRPGSAFPQIPSSVGYQVAWQIGASPILPLAGEQTHFIWERS